MPWAAAATVASAAIGAGTSLIGANKAADASKQAAQLQQQQYQTTRADLAPFRQAGVNVLPALTSLALSGPTGGGPDYVSQADALGGPNAQLALENTPGYQFARTQGLQAVQNSAAARGLGVSGAALKGAATFATGLADQTYQSRFNNLLNLNQAQQGRLNNQYTRLAGVGTIGANAAAQTASAGASAAQAAGGFMNQAGQASAAGILGVGSAANQGLQNYLGYNYLQDMIKRNNQPTAPAVSNPGGNYAL